MDRDNQIAPQQVSKQKKHKVNNDTLLHLEASLNLIPFAGGFLATYFGDIRNNRIAERMQQYFKYFSDRLIELDEKKIDHEYLNSEEFAEFFMQGAEQAARSTTDKRIRRFANILINNALMNAQARSRTQSIMSFVDRISDLDAFVLLCYGNPSAPSLRAQTRDEAYSLVKELSEYLDIDCPSKASVIESIVYMDNLGIAWVNEKLNENEERGKDLILKEFSSFRTPLGDAVVTMIAPPGFYKSVTSSTSNLEWPNDYINKLFRGSEKI